MEASAVYDTDASLVTELPVEHDPSFAPIKEVLYYMVRELEASEWNEAVNACRAEDPDWAPDLSGYSFFERNLSSRDLRGANFHNCTLDWAKLRNCDLTDADFTGATMNGCNVTFANLTGSSYREAFGWDQVVGGESATGYRAPLPDVTEQVARHFLLEAIRDKNSIVNEGLEELRNNGVNAEWQGSELKFWMSNEIERHRNDCDDGDCCCETEHACEGGCECCACYRGDCDCTPDHDYESTYETGEYYLATVIGRVKFEWNVHTGLYGDIRLTDGSLHPHVDTNGTICWGDATTPRSLRVADYLLMVQGWIGQHNPSSEYRPITDLPQIY